MMRLSTRFRKFSCDSPTPPQKLMPDLAEYMTVKEAAKELGITVHGVRRLIKISKLDAILVGKFYLVSRNAVKEYLNLTKGLGKNDPTRGKKPKSD